MAKPIAAADDPVREMQARPGGVHEQAVADVHRPLRRGHLHPGTGEDEPVEHQRPDLARQPGAGDDIVRRYERARTRRCRPVRVRLAQTVGAGDRDRTRGRGGDRAGGREVRVRDRHPDCDVGETV